jgi:hypothetical protein
MRCGATAGGHAANGTVESGQMLGGNPILGRAAIVGVKQWKYAPANHKTQQLEWLEFDPQRYEYE